MFPFEYSTGGSLIYSIKKPSILLDINGLRILLHIGSKDIG